MRQQSTAREGGGLSSEDEYASEGEIERTAEDDKFIDEDDENADLVREYDEQQTFRDERPEGHKKPRADAEDKDANDPVSQALNAIKGKKELKMTEEQKQTLAQELLFRMDKAAKVSSARTAPSLLVNCEHRRMI
jgi:hypothetical protein